MASTEYDDVIVVKNTGEMATFKDESLPPVLRTRFQKHPIFKNMRILPVQVFKDVFQEGIAVREINERLKNPSAADGSPESKQPYKPGVVYIQREVTVINKSKEIIAPTRNVHKNQKTRP